MKTRIVYPDKIWLNKTFHDLSRNSTILAIYLVTNRFIELTPIYKCPDLAIMFDLRLTDKELLKCKAELLESGLFNFYGEWVCIKNDFTYCDYVGRDRVMTAKEKEVINTPEDVKNYFNGVVNPLETSNEPINSETAKGDNNNSLNPLVTPNKPHLNPKSINPKSINPKEGEYERESKEVMNFYNEVFGKKMTSSVSWIANFKFWREHYSVDEIKDAIKSWRYSGWLWKGKDGQPISDIDLSVFFRTSNSAGKCDYISQLLNRGGSKARPRLDPLEQKLVEGLGGESNE